MKEKKGNVYLNALSSEMGNGKECQLYFAPGSYYFATIFILYQKVAFYLARFRLSQLAHVEADNAIISR